MKYAFADDVRLALKEAEEAARHLQHDYVGTEHLLLGVIAVGSAEAVAVRRALGVDEQAVRRKVEESVRRGTSPVTQHGLPYTSRSKKTLEHALAEARRAGSTGIGVEHLFAGLVAEEKSIAAQILRVLGVDLERARQVIAGERAAALPRFRIVIDDASERSIYEQIVAQVQEAVATGALRPGDRLAPVRQLADELDVAPGTVARAYGELERLGLVVTEGARGTRIADRLVRPAARAVDPDMLAGLLRPVAVAAFHMGAGAGELRAALEDAMKGIFDGDVA